MPAHVLFGLGVSIIVHNHDPSCITPSCIPALTLGLGVSGEVRIKIMVTVTFRVKTSIRGTMARVGARVTIRD